MEIIPAIDLRGGQVVRLLRGEYGQETVYETTPGAIAKKWQEGGARLIHIVDLDGAREGEMLNRGAIQSIVQAVCIQTELGGGLRDMASIAIALDELGVTRAILGSVLLENPGLAAEAAQRYPRRIILGIDARDGLVATRGWRTTSSVKALDLLKEFETIPIGSVIYTDIARDGALTGPNLPETARMAHASPFPFIASGGVGDLSHIQALADLNRSLGGKIAGVIVGKALYEGKFTLPEAIAAAGR
ncbi:MAG: 1-(5-phosphoribosyl)-5-[(5-phosphoribosylamino)methylideneamino]imidazole-4-carboxamide isomerase [Candidatus Omnitrophota bacterium]